MIIFGNKLKRGSEEGKTENMELVDRINDPEDKIKGLGEKENNNERLHRRLLNDWDNETMDYNRINYTEIFSAFGCDVPMSITHWRVAKIMEGISICSDQLLITKGITPNEVPNKIYKQLEAGGVNVKDWPIKLKNKGKDEEIIKVSLADFAHFVDIIKTNRELGMHRFDMDTLAFNYFTGKDLKVKVENLSGKDEGEKEVNLYDENINPRDDYKDLDIKGYLSYIKTDDVQGALQMLTDWRYKSDGHREMAGQAIQLENGLFVPLCGGMAAKITMSDLLKQDKSGMNGQPQEVAEIDENTGAFIRFSLRHLEQRRRGGDIRNVQKTQRMSKAMCGLTLNEDALTQTEMVSDKKENKNKKIIYLCGKNLEGNIITGMKTRYNESMKRVRGFGLSDLEAADLVMTDVIVPCILNNPNDWLTALAIAYGVGGIKGSQSLLQNREVFQGFELKIMCRNMEKSPDYPIESKTFHGFNQLSDYVFSRVSAGHIDQPNANNFAVRVSEDMKQEMDPDLENIYFLNKIDSLQGKNIYGVFEAILGDKTKEYVNKYILEGAGAEFEDFRVKKVNKKSKKVKYDFDGIVAKLLQKKLMAEDSDTEVAIEKLYLINLADDEDDIDSIVSGLLSTIQNLSEIDRKKIIP